MGSKIASIKRKSEGLVQVVTNKKTGVWIGRELEGTGYFVYDVEAVDSKALETLVKLLTLDGFTVLF